MKRILTGLFALLIVAGLCVGGLSLCVNAAGQTSSPTTVAEQANSSEQETEMTFGDRLSQAGMVTLEGLGRVFGVLALLWGVIELFHWIVKRSSKKKTAPTSSPAPVKPAEPMQTVSVPVPDESDDGELISAITAAVAAYLASEAGGEYTGGFRVVSFRRIGNGSAWNKK